VPWTTSSASCSLTTGRDAGRDVTRHPGRS
jgi:hypothetical protein